MKPLQVPSPYSNAGTPAALNGTLSPLSPHLIPSPAGSVSSVGSAVSSAYQYTVYVTAEYMSSTLIYDMIVIYTEGSQNVL